MRREVRFLGVHQVHGHPRLAPRRRQRVDPDLVGLGEAHHAAGDPALHGPAAGRGHRDGADPVRRGQENRLARRELEARLVEPRRMQPA